ncbi:uncharacterized protein LOC131634104 [Vicia villosa]|uniref:uncharacterized protein LOC131634104 n=1 Tax=Vicia villosa TaxID=3911 RepID=UPI00273CB904|nr:uncharacterized protein LOC131634104 [Vicia villosa]
MIVLSYNLRGCGSSAKRKCLRELIRTVQVDVFFIQESKLSNFDLVDVKSLWGEGDMEWSAKWSVGRSGGIMTMWKVWLFEVLYSFIGDGFLGLSMNWPGKIVYVVNVYASCFLDKKKEMCNKLRELRNKFQEGEWCIGGDFNVVCDKGKRKGIGVQMDGGEIQEFNEFISLMDLLDLPVLGNRFTWFNLAGLACSRIERFLSFLEEGWKALSNIRGKPGFVLKEKLSKLKAMIRIWNKEVFGVLDLDFNNTISNLNKLDAMVAAVEGGINTDIGEARSVASKSLWDAVNNRESMLK